MKPSIKPKTCLRVTFSPNHNKAIIIVLKAVVAFKIASMLESAPKLPYENNVKGIALFVRARTIECLHADFKSMRYFFLSNIGIKTNDAIVNLA